MSTTAHVISVSRRTDIPAWYMPWFLNRIKAGFAQYRNPFGGQIYEVSLKPDDMMAFVFWSRNYEPFLPHWKHLRQLGYDGYFHFTITGLGPPFEPYSPSSQKMIDVFKILSDQTSPQQVLWRFDPILVSNITPTDEIPERFGHIARQLCGYTERCYISVVDLYKKTARNLEVLADQGIMCQTLSLEQELTLTQHLVNIATTYHIQLHACCETNLLAIPQVQQAHCVDAALLRDLFPEKFHVLKKAPTREGCGCFASRDIGAYDTCVFGCVYCYATVHHQQALHNYRLHDPQSPLLLS